MVAGEERKEENALGRSGEGRLWGGTRDREEIRVLPVGAILMSPFQARRIVGEDELRQLVESIRHHGVLQPVLVRPFGKGYELIAGERRLRASKIAGLKTIPAVVKEFSDREAAVVGLVENLQREDLTFFEEAEGFQRMTEEFGLTQQELAELVGKSQPAVANKLRLLKLGDRVRSSIMDGKLSERHARTLLRLDGEEAQLEVVGEILRADLTVRETEELVEARLSGGVQGSERRDARERKIVHVVKDIRIFLNSFRQAVRLLKKTGVGVEMEERDTGDEIELVVRIPKAR